MNGIHAPDKQLTALNPASEQLLCDTGEHFRTGYGGAPVLFNVLDHQAGSLIMSDVGGVFGIVHGVGEITNQYTVFTKPGHTADGKGAVHDTHIGMDSHDEQCVDAFLFEEVKNFIAIVGDSVKFSDRDSRMLACPCPISGIVGITTAVGVIDGQIRAWITFGSGKCDSGGILHAFSLGQTGVES